MPDIKEIEAAFMRLEVATDAEAEIRDICRVVEWRMSCSSCSEMRLDTVLTGFDNELFEFAKAAWKRGWMMVGNDLICSQCRDDAEEWRSI